MINLSRETRFAADANRFLHAFDQLIAFAAHVGRVLTLVLRRDLAQLDQLFGFRKERGRINQGRRDAERPGLHLAPHQLPHLVELFRRRWFVFQADNVFADRGRADE